MVILSILPAANVCASIGRRSIGRLRDYTHTEMSWQGNSPPVGIHCDGNMSAAACRVHIHEEVQGCDAQRLQQQSGPAC